MQILLPIYLVFGFFIILGYISYYFRFNSNELWGNIINKNLRVIYIISIILATLSTIYLIIYYSKNEEKRLEDGENTWFIITLIGSIIFLFFSLIYAVNPFFLTKYILFSVLIGSLILLICESIYYKNNPLIILCLVYLAFHTGFFDFLLYNNVFNILNIKH